MRNSTGSDWNLEWYDLYQTTKRRYSTACCLCVRKDSKSASEMGSHVAPDKTSSRDTATSGVESLNGILEAVVEDGEGV